MGLVTEIALHEVARAAQSVLQRPVEISADTDISRDLAVDSLALMNIVMELEDRFDISIPLASLSEIRTAGDLSSLIDDIRNRG